jgi:hypothetical protein
MRECFVVAINEHADGADRAGDRKVIPNPVPNPLPAPPPASSVDIAAQLTQVHELEAKLAEEHWQVQLLRATITGEASTRGECARDAGRRARDRINTDYNVDDPQTLP